MRRLLILVVAVLALAGTAQAAPNPDALRARILAAHAGQLSRLATLENLAVQPQASLTEQGSDLVFTVTGLIPGDKYAGSYIVDNLGCVGLGTEPVGSNGTITFYVGEDQIDFVTRDAGWSHVHAKLQAPNAGCAGEEVIGADFTRSLALL